jgi:hypothetical protein
MARVDIQRLEVPADFAAIFDKSATAAIETTTPPPASSAPAASAASPTIEACAKCNCRLSAVEAKMGRCLSCGTVFAANQVKVGI